MGTDQIRNKPLGLELLSSPSTSLSTNDLRFGLHHQGVHTWGVAAIEAVAEMAETFGHATTPIQRINPQGHQLVLTLLGQALNDVDVLPREVLMNEKNPH